MQCEDPIDLLNSQWTQTAHFVQRLQTVKKRKCWLVDTASVTKTGKHMYLHTDQGNEQKLYNRAKINIGIIQFCGLFLLVTYLLTWIKCYTNSMFLIASLNTAALSHNMPLCCQNPHPIRAMWLLNTVLYSQLLPPPRPPKCSFSSEPRFQSSSMYAFPITWDIQFHTHIK